jgi:hypothetical protein
MMTLPTPFDSCVRTQLAGEHRTSLLQVETEKRGLLGLQTMATLFMPDVAVGSRYDKAFREHFTT